MTTKTEALAALDAWLLDAEDTGTGYHITACDIAAWTDDDWRFHMSQPRIIWQHYSNAAIAAVARRAVETGDKPLARKVRRLLVRRRG